MLRATTNQSIKGKKIERKNLKLNFHLASNLTEFQFPEDLIPDLVTTEGSAFFTLDEKQNFNEALFESIG